MPFVGVQRGIVCKSEGKAQERVSLKSASIFAALFYLLLLCPARQRRQVQLAGWVRSLGWAVPRDSLSG